MCNINCENSSHYWLVMILFDPLRSFLIHLCRLPPCLTNPCLNGGDCFTINNIIACNCPTGFSGIENTKY